MAKENKVEVQKGPIQPDQYNYKYIPREERARQDAEMNRDRASGKKLTLHMPKK